MTDPTLLHDRGQLEALFEELASELHSRGLHAEVVMVGGSWMLWHGDRAATRDVDSAKRLDADIRDAIRTIGERRDLAETWLNDHAAMFWPNGASLDAAPLVLERPGLTVRAPEPDVVFVMKLYRSEPQDREDMIDLWPRCSFPSPARAAAAYDAYPHAPEDPHLADFIAGIARDASTR